MGSQYINFIFYWMVVYKFIVQPEHYMESHMTSPYCIYYNATVVWSHIFHKKVGWQNKNPIHQGDNTGVLLTLALHFGACIDNQSGMGIAMHTILCPEVGSITPTPLQTIAVFFLQSAGLAWWLNLTFCWLDVLVLVRCCNRGVVVVISLLWAKWWLSLKVANVKVAWVCDHIWRNSIFGG